MARSSNPVRTVKLQVSVDPTTGSIIDKMVRFGIYGRNTGEVASWIMREWIIHNQDTIRETETMVESLPIRKS